MLDDPPPRGFQKHPSVTSDQDIFHSADHLGGMEGSGTEFPGGGGWHQGSGACAHPPSRPSVSVAPLRCRPASRRCHSALPPAGFLRCWEKLAADPPLGDMVDWNRAHHPVPPVPDPAPLPSPLPVPVPPSTATDRRVAFPALHSDSF